MNASSDSVRPVKRHGLLFKLGVVFGIFVALLVVLYFVVTSSAFFTGFILPKVSKAANAEISVSSASISPWSEVVLNNLKVVPNGREQLVQAELVRARYSLKDIIGGRIVVSEVTLSSPVVTIVNNADGTSNLDPLTQKKPEAAPKEAKPSKPSAPPQLDIKNVALKNAQVQMINNLKGGGREVAQISNFNFAIDQIHNGQPGKLTYSGDLAFDRTGTPTNNPAGTVAAKLNGAFGFMTTANLEPQSVSGTSQVDITKATGAMSNLTAVGVNLDCDMTPTEIRKINLRLQQSGNLLGELRVAGPFVAATQEGRLKVELLSVDQKTLNMVGTPMGFDFNKTALASSNDIELKEKGNVITINGQFNANNLSVTQKAKNQTTPILNILAAYQVNVDQNKKSALISKFDINGTQNNKKFLQTSLSKPMPVSWGGNAGMPDEAALDLAITQFNLADWKSFAGDIAPAGTLDTTLHLISRAGGKNLAVDLSTKLNDFSARFGSNQISGAAIEVNSKFQVADFNKITLENYHVQLAREGIAAVTLDGSGTVNTDTKDMQVKAVMETQIPQLLKIVQVPNIKPSAGTVRFEGQIAQNKDSQTVVGNLSLTSLSGNFAKYTLDRLQTKVDLDVAVKGDALQINKANGSLEHAGLAGGTFGVSGGANIKTKAGKFNLKLTDLNQNLLKPFVTPALNGKQLVNASINADVNASMEANGAANLQGDLGITNLVVKAADQAAPAPLAAQFKVDGSFQQQVLDLRQFQIALSPTARAKNQIDFKGQVDLSQTNALKADLAIRADSIDVTPFYDIFSGQKGATNVVAQAPQPAPGAGTAAPAPAPTEPDAMQLPIQQVVVNLNIGQFYLREVAITNWQTGVKIQGSHIVVNPFQLVLNGAPVKSTVDANVGVKGYVYDVTFSMDKVPVEPLANSFVPGKKGAFTGVLMADAQIKGAGITGTSLRKNLQGQSSFSLTNAAIQLQTISDTKILGISMGAWVNTLLKPISVALSVPEMLTDPLNSAGGNLTFGQGKIGVQSMKLQSQAFIGNIHGDIPIADVLTDSPLNLPMAFSLSQSLVKKIPVISSLAQGNEPFVDLPELVKVGGTLGKPATKVNLAGLTGKSAISILKGIGGQTGGKDTKSIIGGVGGILGGQAAPQGANTNAGTNAPNTNTNTPQPAINNLINNLFKK